jgi:hypothetical protein
MNNRDTFRGLLASLKGGMAAWGSISAICMIAWGFLSKHYYSLLFSGADIAPLLNWLYLSLCIALPAVALWSIWKLADIASIYEQVKKGGWDD